MTTDSQPGIEWYRRRAQTWKQAAKKARAQLGSTQLLIVAAPPGISQKEFSDMAAELAKTGRSFLLLPNGYEGELCEPDSSVLRRLVEQLAESLCLQPGDTSAARLVRVHDVLGALPDRVRQWGKDAEQKANPVRVVMAPGHLVEAFEQLAAELPTGAGDGE